MQLHSDICAAMSADGLYDSCGEFIGFSLDAFDTRMCWHVHVHISG